MALFEQENGLPDAPEGAPLAVRMRPRNLDEVVGQQHFCGRGKLLRRMIEADRLTSVVFYGPPGTGKTSLAHVVARHTKAFFHQINATASNVKEMREILSDAGLRKTRNRMRTVLFIDELHRFNRAQQDVLLPDVERGTIILVGATTHNPFFALNSPLLSRSQIFQFKPLSEQDIRLLLRRAIDDGERGLGGYDINIEPEAVDHLVKMCDGDARRALQALEVGVLSSVSDDSSKVDFDLKLAEDSIQKKAIVYDRDEDEHYDSASAFIKSMRGTDPDAALYWMMKMLEGGEDPRFIARRLVVCAAEDVGNAAPNALVLANAAQQAVEFVGMPEAAIPLAQAVTYIASAPKSNASYEAMEKARKDVREGRTLPVPDHLRDSSYEGASRLGHGEGYKYAHNYEDHWVDQDYIPTSRIYYEPSESGQEAKIARKLKEIRKKRGIS